MENIAKGLIATFTETNTLMKDLDKDKSYLMVLSVNDQFQYLLETYLQVTDIRDPEDTAHHAINPIALVENYTNVPELRKLLPGQHSGAIGSLSRFDIGQHKNQLWLLYKDGVLTWLNKGVVYLASLVIQKHYITFVRDSETDKLTATIGLNQIGKWIPPGRKKKRVVSAAM